MTTPLTKADLERFEALARTATPGPWYRVDAPWRDSDMPPFVVAGSQDPHAARFVCDVSVEVENIDDDDRVDLTEHDAAFIADARDGWPATLAALREAVELLRSVEWEGRFVYDEDNADCCPVCKGWKPIRADAPDDYFTNELRRMRVANGARDGHAPDCTLTAFLRRFA